MKNTARITFSAIMASLAVVIMLTSYFPYLTYAIPAIAGLCSMVVLIEINYKWAIFSYISSAVLVFMFGEMESKFLYVFLFGYYPIAKALIEKFGKPVVEWIIKILLFNISILVVYVLFSTVFPINLDEFGPLKEYGIAILLILANVVFVVYDIAVSRMSVLYLNIIHPKIKRLFKKGF
jgi:hypothetical protein